jgi:hypothetical protein
MIKYAIQLEGEDKIAVAIIGDDMEEMTQHYWGFWNYGATSGTDIIWSNDVVKPYLGYFWTDKKRLKSSIELAAFYTICHRHDHDLRIFKGKRGGVMPLIRKIAQEKMAEFKPMRFLRAAPSHYYFTRNSHSESNIGKELKKEF